MLMTPPVLIRTGGGRWTEGRSEGNSQGCSARFSYILIVTVHPATLVSTPPHFSERWYLCPLGFTGRSVMVVLVSPKNRDTNLQKSLVIHRYKCVRVVCKMIIARSIKEAILIKVNDPSLNRNIGKYQLPHKWNEVLANSPELNLK